MPTQLSRRHGGECRPPRRRTPLLLTSDREPRTRHRRCGLQSYPHICIAAQVLGAGAFAAGAALLPMTVLIVLGMTLVAPRLLTRFGARALIVAGFGFPAVGLVWLAFARPDGTYVVDVLPASLVAAFGMALAFVPSLGTAIGAARPEETGVASGLVNTSCQIGSAVGLAALTVLSSTIAAGSVEPGGTDGWLLRGARRRGSRRGARRRHRPRGAADATACGRHRG